MPDDDSQPLAADEVVDEATGTGPSEWADALEGQQPADTAEERASAREAEEEQSATPNAAESEGPILVISDLHGNLTLLKRALHEGVRLAGREDLTVVLIGDYCDNGPEIRALLEFLCNVMDNGGSYEKLRILPIIGNHDLICLLAACPGIFGARSSPSRLWGRWQYYWNSWKTSTPGSYGSDNSLATFRTKFPRRHCELLESLPWYEELDGYVFVHAGLSETVPVEEQLHFLAAKDLSRLASSGYCEWKGGETGMPDQITNKNWASTNCPDWGCIVVTGHNKYPGSRDFVASNRLGLHSGACQRVFNPTLPLHCALLKRGAVDLTQPHDAPLQFTVR